MSSRPPNEGGGRRRVAEAAAFALVAATVWLGWQIVREMAVERLPPDQSLRLAPASATVLSRAAEAELAADRFDNAGLLARQSLLKAPFNVRALRVLGLTTAKSGDETRADDMLTLAGNWSLRDDPSHAWLMEHRLSRGDYHSAFAHADTLARRRDDLQPQLYKLFTLAASTDARALPVLASLLEASPPWRRNYLSNLYETEDGLKLAANLAITLEPTRSAFSVAELSTLYVELLSKLRLEGLATVRDRLGRPDPDLPLVNGAFAPAEKPLPFEWKLFNAGGSVAEILPDDLRGDSALRAHFGSYSSAQLAEQFLLLNAGPYRLTGEARAEVGDPSTRLTWRITCIETGAMIGESSNTPDSGNTAWKPFHFDFEVPAKGCSAQWLQLFPTPSERRATVVGWYDNFSIVSRDRAHPTETKK